MTETSSKLSAADLARAEAKRDIGAEILQSIQDMKAGKGKVVHSAVAAVLAVGQTACSSHAYDSEAQRYVAAAQGVLIAHSRCSSAADCSQRELLKFSAGGFDLGPIRGGGVEVSLYQQTDAQVWADAQREFTALHALHPNVPVTLKSYAGPHADSGQATNELILK